jgi:hypothetical protein
MEISFLLRQLVDDLARRIAATTPPSWPLPIFEAESYCYRHYLEWLLSVLDGAAARTTRMGFAELFRTPTRPAELSYMLLGLNESGLALGERQRLARYLVDAMTELRPADPLCRRGANDIHASSLAAKALSGPSMLVSATEHSAMRRLNAALLLLSEFVHVGIPQYGREVHGPYRTDADNHTVVRSHFDMQVPEVWADAVAFNFDEVHVLETFHRSAHEPRFDLMNNPISEVPETTRVAFGIRAYAGDAPCDVSSVEALLGEVINAARRLREVTSRFTRADWLRRHLETRHWYLKQHADLAEVSWRPSELEYAHLRDPPPAETVRSLVTADEGALREHLLRSLGVEPETSSYAL